MVLRENENLASLHFVYLNYKFEFIFEVLQNEVSYDSNATSLFVVYARVKSSKFKKPLLGP